MSTHVYTLTLFRPVEISSEQTRAEAVVGSVRYLLTRFFGCWHRQMGRPFTHEGHSYRSCSACGMHRDFDLETWTMKGRYYHAPVDQHQAHLDEGSRRQWPRAVEMKP